MLAVAASTIAAIHVIDFPDTTKQKKTSLCLDRDMPPQAIVHEKEHKPVHPYSCVYMELSHVSRFRFLVQFKRVFLGIYQKCF
jgi:hypothetical protein